MKIKGVIEDLKVKKKLNLKNDNSKNISRNFSGAVVGSVGSVQFQIVPCSTLRRLKVYRPLPILSPF